MTLYNASHHANRCFVWAMSILLGINLITSEGHFGFQLQSALSHLIPFLNFSWEIWSSMMPSWSGGKQNDKHNNTLFYKDPSSIWHNGIYDALGYCVWQLFMMPYKLLHNFFSAFHVLVKFMTVYVLALIVPSLSLWVMCMVIFLYLYIKISRNALSGKNVKYMRDYVNMYPYMCIICICI